MPRFNKTFAIFMPCFVALVTAALVVPPSASSGPSVSGIVSALQSGAWNVGIVGTPEVNISNVPEVSIAGSPGVNVENSPTVKIDASSNSVTVGNSAGNPVPIRNVDGKTPVRYGPAYVGANSTSDYPEVIPEVPAGQILVVTSVNISGFTPNPQPDLTEAACMLQLVSGGGGSFPARIPLSVGFQGFATANLETYLPVNAGESVGVGCGGAPFNANTLYGITFGGYLIPAQ